jgi:hypothetical protein
MVTPKMLRRKGPSEAQLAAAAKPMTRLEERREELRARFTEMQWDLGGAAYEMAARDYFRLDVLAGMASRLQIVDAELAEIERMARLERAGADGSCAGCGSLHARGAIYCWRCGRSLFEAPARPVLMAAPDSAPALNDAEPDVPAVAAPEVPAPRAASRQEAVVPTTVPEVPAPQPEPSVGVTDVVVPEFELPAAVTEPTPGEAPAPSDQSLPDDVPAPAPAPAPREQKPAPAQAPREQEPAPAPAQPTVPQRPFARPWEGAAAAGPVATPGPVTVPPFAGAVEVPTFERPESPSGGSEPDNGGG